MVDIETKNISLKIAWIKRLAQSNKFTVCPLIDMYCKIDTNLLLKCNIHENDISLCFKKKLPPFWIEVLKLWSRYNYKRLSDIANPSNEIIWFNSNIWISNEIVFIKKLADKGILHVKDLLDENYSFYNIEELQYKYNVRINFLTYYSLIHAIPQEFYRNFDCTIPIQLNIDRLLCIEKVPKLICKELIKKKTMFPEKSYLWHQETLQINISRENFISHMVSNNKCIMNNKFKDFQFRLIHNALVKKTRLKSGAF